MFHGENWAAAFVTVLGDDAGAGLECLKAMVPAVQAAHGELFGHSAARQLEALLRESVMQSGFGGGQNTAESRAAEYAVRFISLLVEKNLFVHIGPLVNRIEQKIDRQNNILNITAETARPLDSAVEEELRRRIMETTGAAGIKMNSRLVPELLGGYRIRIGGYYIDASLKGQLETMAADLKSAALTGGGA